MIQLELDFERMPGVIKLPSRPSSSRDGRTSRRNLASVAVFPFSRRCSTIQNIALGLETRRGRRRTEFWQQTISTMRELLIGIGQPDEAINVELRQFKSAVQAEIDRMRFGDEPHGNRGGVA